MKFRAEDLSLSDIVLAIDLDDHPIFEGRIPQSATLTIAGGHSSVEAAITNVPQPELRFGVAITLGKVISTDSLPTLTGRGSNFGFEFENCWVSCSENIPDKTKTFTFSPNRTRISTFNSDFLALQSVVIFRGKLDALKYYGIENSFLSEPADKTFRSFSGIILQINGAVAFLFESPERISKRKDLLVLLVSDSIDEAFPWTFASFISFLLGGNLKPLELRHYGEASELLRSVHYQHEDSDSPVSAPQSRSLIPYAKRSRSVKDIGAAISSLLEKYLELRNNLALDPFVELANASNLLPFHLQVHPLATAMDLIANSWFQSVSTESGGTWIDGQEFSKILEEVAPPLQDALCSLNNGEKVWSRVQSSNRMGTTLRIPRFLEEIGISISKNEQKILKFRNSAIHGSLKTSKSKQEQFQLTWGYYALIARTFLRLLGYTGLYIDYSALDFPIRNIDESLGLDDS